MEQLIAHLIGDFWLQNDWMAINKKKSFMVALYHSFLYTLPFLFITQSIPALLVIWLTHAVIDGTEVVKKLNQVKNGCFQTEDGYKPSRPDHIRHWLLIFQDNTLHLLINFLAIKFL